MINSTGFQIIQVVNAQLLSSRSSVDQMRILVKLSQQYKDKTKLLNLCKFY